MKKILEKPTCILEPGVHVHFMNIFMEKLKLLYSLVHKTALVSRAFVKR